MVSGINSLNPTPYGSMVSGGVGSGKIYVQVKPNQVVYSQFEHVAGYASSKSSDSGVSVSKINKSALVSPDTIADKVSLSPMTIS